MPIDVVRLRDSDFAATPDAEGFRCGLLLWMAAWHQVPAGSIPSDTSSQARLCGYGRNADTYSEHRDVALHGFIECSDGRFYHPVICEKAEEAWAKKSQAKKAASKRWADKKRLYPQQKPDNADALNGHMREQSERNADGYADLMHRRGQGIDRKNLKKEFAETFWTKYPHKVGKPVAERAYLAKRKTTPLETILAGLDRYVASKPPNHPWMNPATWLNGEHWNDQPSYVANGNGHSNGHANAEPPPRQTRDEYLETLLGLYAKTHEWNDVWGERSELPPEFAARLAAIDEASSQASLPGLS